MRRIGYLLYYILLLNSTSSLIAQSINQGLVDSLKRVSTQLSKDKAKQGWSVKGTTNISFSQIALVNWTAGGNNSITISGLGMYNANYVNDKITWNNYLEIGYGLAKIGNTEFRKSDDRIILVSQTGIAAGEFMNHSLLVDFRTQFTDGRNYAAGFDSVLGDYPLTSSFMSPGFLTTALGMEIKPTSYISALLSPLTGRMTIVTNRTLSEQGAFSVPKGTNIRANLGALLNVHIQKEILDNVFITARLNVFSPFSQPDIMVVNWENMLSLKVNSFIKVTMSADLFYDHNIIITRADGTKGPATQFRNIYGVGFGYTF